ncbi:MAG: hypothetical protein NTY88_09670 [Bacteroidetes bacterium]|nr:hypothetical protein [Bacteroidota bacterium]
MKRILLPAFFAIVFILTHVSSALATHTMGVDMTYECISPGQYRITLQVYRDCNGVAMVGSHRIDFSSVQCGVNSSITVT